MTNPELLRQLEKSQRLVALLRCRLDEAEARRDEFLRMLADNAGAHDRRFVGVR